MTEINVNEVHLSGGKLTLRRSLLVLYETKKNPGYPRTKPYLEYTDKRFLVKPKRHKHLRELTLVFSFLSLRDTTETSFCNWSVFQKGYRFDSTLLARKVKRVLYHYINQWHNVICQTSKKQVIFYKPSIQSVLYDRSAIISDPYLNKDLFRVIYVTILLVSSFLFVTLILIEFM